MRDRRENIGSFIIKERWSPYLVGAGLGMLSWGIFASMGKACHIIGYLVTLGNEDD